MKYLLLLLISIFLIKFTTVEMLAQDETDSLFFEKEKNINELFTQMASNPQDYVKEKINSRINDSLYALLLMEGVFDHSFDSLINVGKLFLNDVKIYTWNLPKSNGSQQYFGYIQYEIEKDSIIIYSLTDKSSAIKNPEYVKCTNKNWYGALYYDITKVSVDKKDYYVLMGFDPNNLFTNKKVIDVLYFDELGIPTFGYPFFEDEKGMKYRVVFEYAKRAAMSLRYNKKLKMIVFDHLAPFEERYKGVRQFYGPDFSYDAYDFQKGTWKLVQDVDVRN